MENYTLTSTSSEQTIQIAKDFASHLSRYETIVLTGELGAGKTKFVEGILSYFGLESEISSPTFTIVNEYSNNLINIYHFDVYKLKNIEEFYAIGGNEYFGKGICLIEWGEQIESALPANYIKISFEKGNAENTRIFHFSLGTVLNEKFLTNRTVPNEKFLTNRTVPNEKKVLSITTSSPICGVAVLDNNSVIKEVNLDNGLTHSETLMPLIKQVLEECNLNLNDIGLLVSDIGPGSFTGIRIGVSTVKAFADSLNINSVGVSSLEALSFNFLGDGLCASLIDAKKGNVYSQVFETVEGKRLAKNDATFGNIDSFLLELKENFSSGSITFVGSGTINYKEKILALFPEAEFLEQNSLLASNVGFAGLYNYLNGKSTDVQPIYFGKDYVKQNGY